MDLSHPCTQRYLEKSWPSQPPGQPLLVAGVQVCMKCTWRLISQNNWSQSPHHWHFRFFETKTSGPLPNRFSLPLPRRLKRWLKSKLRRESEGSGRPPLSSVSVQDLSKWSDVWWTRKLALTKSPERRGCVYLEYPDSHPRDWSWLPWRLPWRPYVPAVTWHDQCHEENLVSNCC